jgi:hypothetical protein
MRLYRYDNRLGLVEQDEVVELTPALEVLRAVCWPVPPGDLLIRARRRERGVSRVR